MRGTNNGDKHREDSAYLWICLYGLQIISLLNWHHHEVHVYFCMLILSCSFLLACKTSVSCNRPDGRGRQSGAAAKYEQSIL